MAGQFTGKVVMVTGAPGSVGRAVVDKFASEGAKLVVVDRRHESCLELAQELESKGHECLAVSGDIGQPDDMARIVSEAEAKFGQIDVLAHIAGGFAAGDPVHEAGIDVFEKMMYLNARLTYVACGHVAKHMVEKGVKGSIVAVLARAALKGSKNNGAYTASKAAAQRIVESMAAELMEYDIRVNGVMPSIVDTPPNREAMSSADFSKWVTPAQVADVIAFLASDAANSVSGDSVAVYNKA